MSKRYRLLKELPDMKAGEIIEVRADDIYPYNFDAHHDFFEPLDEPEYELMSPAVCWAAAAGRFDIRGVFPTAESAQDDVSHLRVVPLWPLPIVIKTKDGSEIEGELFIKVKKGEC